MRGISALGPGSVMWAMIVALFFGGYPRLGARLALFTLLAMWTREVLALSLQSPRPYWLDPTLKTFGDVATKRTSYGLPSGHAFVGTAFWFFLAAESRRAWAWVAAVLLVGAICFSRLYLGVHFVTDVSLGAVLGGLFAWGYRWLEPRGTAVGAGLSPGQGTMVAVVVGAVLVGIGWAVRSLVLTEPIPEMWSKYALEARRPGTFALLGGSLSGLLIGLYRARAEIWASLERPASWTVRMLRVGLAGGLGYGVSRVVQLPVMRGTSPAAEDLPRVGILFGAATILTALVWWGLPRLLDAVGFRWRSRGGRTFR